MKNIGTSNYSEQELIEKIRSIPPEKIVELVDFVDFLCQREQTGLVSSATKLSETAFQNIWDNPEDAVYDQL